MVFAKESGIPNSIFQYKHILELQYMLSLDSP